MPDAPNPIHLQVALQESKVQLELMSSRALQLAVELHDARNSLAALQEAFNGLSSKLEALESKE